MQPMAQMSKKLKKNHWFVFENFEQTTTSIIYYTLYRSLTEVGYNYFFVIALLWKNVCIKNAIWDLIQNSKFRLQKVNNSYCHLLLHFCLLYFYNKNLKERYRQIENVAQKLNCEYR